MRKYLLLFLSTCLIYSSSVQAAVGIGGFERGVSATGQTVYFAPSGYAAKSSAQVGQMIFNSAVAPSTSAVIASTAKVAVGAGEAAIAVKGVITSAALFGALKGAMGGPLGIAITVALAAPALIDWLKEKDIRTRPGDKDKPFEKAVKNQTCVSGTCYEYRANFNNIVGTWAGSPNAAFTSTLDKVIFSPQPNYEFIKNNLGCVDLVCRWSQTNNRITPFLSETFAQTPVDIVRRVVPPSTDEIWVPKTIEEIRSDMEAVRVGESVIDALNKAGLPIPISYPPSSDATPMTGPPSVSGIPVITKKTDGDVDTTTTTTTKTDLQYGPVPHPVSGVPTPAVTATTNTTVVVTTVNNVTGATTTTNQTTNNPASPPPDKPSEQAVTCGLPDTPACKIDETGTLSDATAPLAESKTTVDAAKKTADDAIAAAANIESPKWTFSFQFPTGCAPYVTGIRGFILNVCPYQPQIHSLLSAIWAASTIFAMIGMVGRTIRGT